jgi:mono/diheme cytochrome c family protein
MSRIIVALLSFMAMGLLPTAASAGAADGEKLAKRWCAACHVVASDQKSGSTQAPAFSTVAAKRGFNAGALALFLLTPHPKMPDMNLSRGEAADLAAYIATQK